MNRRIFPLLVCALVIAVPTSIAAYDLGRPDAKLLAGDFTMADPTMSAPPSVGLSLQGWDGGAWQPPPATHITLTLFNVNSRQLREFVVSPEGTSHGDARKLQTFFRCKRSGRSHKMSTGVIAVLADVARRWPDRTIEIVSGYRRRGTGARRSKHYTGHAIDFRVRGVPVSEVRDFVWANHASIGLGHYHSGGFLHIDHRPKEPKIGWNQYRNSSRYRYNPSWTK